MKRHAILTIGGVALAMAAGAAVESGAMVSADFEKGGGVWRRLGKEWRIEEGRGVDGSKCLTLEYPEAGR